MDVYYSVLLPVDVQCLSVIVELAAKAKYLTVAAQAYSGGG
jgi:hypothetical protein